MRNAKSKTSTGEFDNYRLVAFDFFRQQNNSYIYTGAC